MTRKIIFSALVLLLISLTQWSCKKNEVKCTDEETFCTLVNDKNYEATGPLINNFLSTLKKDSQDESLQKLADWLECKSCVAKAEIRCNSCILTNPPQSEIQVVFYNQWTTDTLIMDILMDEPVKFLAYHQ